MLEQIVTTLLLTIRDVVPIITIIFGFQWLVIRRHVPNLKKTLIGFIYVIIGLTLFLVGLEKALFPLGKVMAQQLTDPSFVNPSLSAGSELFCWHDYKWVYLFAAAIGFATTIAEPSLIAVAIKAEQVSVGAVNAWGLRIAVGIGVALGLALGTFRIVTGTPLQYYIIAGYIIILIQTVYAPRMITALAYDSGGVTTSTVTVPLVTALGLGLAATVPGRSALLDGFGLIAYASLFPIMSVLGYAQVAAWREHRAKVKSSTQQQRK